MISQQGYNTFSPKAFAPPLFFVLKFGVLNGTETVMLHALQFLHEYPPEGITTITHCFLNRNV